VEDKPVPTVRLLDPHLAAIPHDRVERGLMNAGQPAFGRVRDDNLALEGFRPLEPASGESTIVLSSKANSQEPHRSIQQARRSCGRGWRSASVVVSVIFSSCHESKKGMLAGCREHRLLLRLWQITCGHCVGVRRHFSSYISPQTSGATQSKQAREDA
jgi:hypothetical protein